MAKLKGLDFVALVLIVIGGINWGLVGLLKLDLVAVIFGELSILSRIVYLLVGLAAVYAAVRSPHFAHLKEPERAEATHKA
jgi:uncharacterized membrane protein YuzA (DUF378 family)